MKINDCPNCGSNRVASGATEAVEWEGCEHQIMWLQCEDCGLEGPSFEIDDCMNEIERNELLLEMVREWNNILPNPLKD